MPLSRNMREKKKGKSYYDINSENIDKIISKGIDFNMFINKNEKQLERSNSLQNKRQNASFEYQAMVQQDNQIQPQANKSQKFQNYMKQILQKNQCPLMKNTNLNKTQKQFQFQKQCNPTTLFSSYDLNNSFKSPNFNNYSTSPNLNNYSTSPNPNNYSTSPNFNNYPTFPTPNNIPTPSFPIFSCLPPDPSPQQHCLYNSVCDLTFVQFFTHIRKQLGLLYNSLEQLSIDKKYAVSLVHTIQEATTEDVRVEIEQMERRQDQLQYLLRCLQQEIGIDTHEVARIYELLVQAEHQVDRLPLEHDLTQCGRLLKRIIDVEVEIQNMEIKIQIFNT